MKPRKYDKQFKLEAVRLALTSTQTTIETAHDLGIKESTLYNWISKYNKKISTSSNDANENEINVVEELNRLRKENARLKEEREILKKAAKHSRAQGPGLVNIDPNQLCSQP